MGIGLIGCGSNGQIHADGLAKLAAEGEIRAVIAGDPSAPSREAAQRNCAFETLTGAPDEVASHPDVDAVVVAGPTASHGEAIRAALASGKAIMCEKPLASSFDEVVSLVDAVAASGVVAQVGFQSRFNPVYSWLREVIAEGTFGAPLGYMLREDQFWPTGSVVPGHSSWRSDPAQSGGGPLLEHSIHACDLLVWMFGPVTSVSARTASLFGFGVEDIAAGHVQHGNGVIGTITTVFNGVEGREERRLEVFLEQATIELTGDFIVGADEEAVIVHRPGVADETVDLAPCAKPLSPRPASVDGTSSSTSTWRIGPSSAPYEGGRPATPGFGDALRRSRPGRGGLPIGRGRRFTGGLRRPRLVLHGPRSPAASPDAVGHALGGGSSCSMNSSRIPPGASTKAMRRRPKVPSTTSGPHTTVWPSSCASRSSVNRAGWRNPSRGSVHLVLVDGPGEQGDHHRTEVDVGPLAVTPLHAVLDLGPGGLVEPARGVEVLDLDGQVGQPGDGHRSSLSLLFLRSSFRLVPRCPKPLLRRRRPAELSDRPRDRLRLVRDRRHVGPVAAVERR